jgi:hypothetical protein
MSRRSEQHRADKYKTRAEAMLDQFRWQKEEEFFLGLMESGELTIQEIRELTWEQIKDSYEGLLIRGRPLVLREDILNGFRKMLQEETGLYGESFSGEAASFHVFAKETLKFITKELDQFKDV